MKQKIGASGGTRTPDQLLITNQLLYQLSYLFKSMQNDPFVLKIDQFATELKFQAENEDDFF
jgi:hypothetical protein